MGNRLSKIYTRTGDDGTTGLGGGARVAKDAIRVEAYGTVDELNSIIGVLLCESMPEADHDFLIGVQHHLFDLGGELCMPGYESMQQAWIDDMETELDRLNADLPPLKEFILPGGGRAGSLAHQARTVCRRAERRVVTLQREEDVRPEAVGYLNRLSDYLFVLARHLAKQNGEPETLWRHERSKTKQQNAS